MCPFWFWRQFTFLQLVQPIIVDTGTNATSHCNSCTEGWPTCTIRGLASCVHSTVEPLNADPLSCGPLATHHSTIRGLASCVHSTVEPVNADPLSCGPLATHHSTIRGLASCVHSTVEPVNADPLSCRTLATVQWNPLMRTPWVADPLSCGPPELRTPCHSP